jgi:hypothetical protein
MVFFIYVGPVPSSGPHKVIAPGVSWIRVGGNPLATVEANIPANRAPPTTNINIHFEIRITTILPRTTFICPAKATF